MSTKLTIIFYILVCFEIGVILLFLPWHSYWDENFFLHYISTRLHWQWLVAFMHSGYVRGAVSGIGVINLLIGFGEIINFKKTVNSLDGPEKSTYESTQPQAVSLLDNRPAEDSSAK